MSWSWSWPYNERHSELEENQLNMKGSVIPRIVDFNTNDTTEFIRKTFIKNYQFSSEYNEDDGKYTENCKTDFELGQMKSDTVFHNRIFIDNPAEAKAAGKALWDVTKDVEKKMME